MSSAGTSHTSINKRGTHETLSGFFSGAIGTDASNSIFTEYNMNILRNESASEDITKILDTLNPADRGGHYVVPCMDGTRKHIFEEIDNWLGDGNGPNILWLSGSPGAGKSAIASSMVSRLTKGGRLGSYFFFRRGDVSLNDPTALWRTVAYDLSKRNSTFANYVAETLKEGSVDLRWPDVDLHSKFLIEGPLMKIYTDLAPPVVVIDALDECDADRSHAAQRDALLNTLIKWSRLSKKFKLIVTGRDDRIPESFRTACKRIVLPTGHEVCADANEDIRLFFNRRFSESVGSLFPQWPGEKILHDLTARAAGLFIWAETVMKLLKQGLPDEQLQLILHGDLGEEDNLTDLYKQFLYMAFRGFNDRTLEVYKVVVSAITLARIPFHPDDLPEFLGQPKLSVNFILDKLTPVLSIGTADIGLRISHLSFAEFLCDPKRCPMTFYIDRGKESQRLAIACFERMGERLKFNICNLETSYLLNDTVKNMSERIAKNIPGPLSYSCRFWVAHLRDSTGDQSGRKRLLQEVREFLEHRFLFWLEVMSFFKEVLAANAALLSVIPWVAEFDTGLSALAQDASRFIINFDIPISESVPHIYLSALPFSPSDSPISKQYQTQFPNTLSVASGRDKKWPAMVNLFRGHASPVRSVAFSHDGKRVVSGSDDKTIRIWDVETGQAFSHPFEGHTSLVNSVMFSHDCGRIVSGSSDKTIRIWDVETGQVTTAPLEGHTSWVISVAFSHDDKKIASGSFDKTIRIWDTETGQVTTGPFTGHTSSVNSVAFSHDGKRVVSGSDDKTVRIWDVETGQITAAPFIGHTFWVNSVAFSYDGIQVVSGSGDKSIRVWDVKTGNITVGPLEDHTSFVNSVAFSHDGKLVVSGSNDNTIRIWNIETGQVAAGPFDGHTSRVTSVAFSHDSKRVVSGSFDKTVRIWDIETSQSTTGSFVGHNSFVKSVAVSHDGKRVVSCALDKTIRIWDAETGNVAADPLEGHSSFINSIAFSHDSKLIVSGSDDKTVRIWDANTGQVTAGPFEGHTSRVNCVAFSHDSKQVVSGSNDETIRIWDVETGQTTTTLPFKGHTSWVTSVVFSHDSKRVVSGSYDRTIRIWDVETGQVIAGPIEGHTSWVNSVAFSHDSKRVVSCSLDKTVRIWDVETGLVTAGPFCGHTSSVNSVAFSYNGKRVVSGSNDGTIRVWDAETGQITAGPFEDHNSSVNSVIFSHDDRWVISGSDDNTVRIWDVEIGRNTAHYAGRRYNLDPESGWAFVAELDSPNDHVLFWVPPHCRAGLCDKATLVVIGATAVQLDFSHFVHGKSWTQCYSHRNTHLIAGS